jgi:hypothetical protein
MAKVRDNIFDNFSEEALEALDFARCQRSDGSIYGTSGKCRKGTETNAAPESEKSGGRKPAIDENKLYRLSQKRNQLADRLSREKGLLKRMNPAAKYEPMRKARQERIAKLEKSYKRISELHQEANRRLDKQARETGRPRALMPSNWGTTPQEERAARRGNSPSRKPN